MRPVRVTVRYRCTSSGCWCPDTRLWVWLRCRFQVCEVVSCGKSLQKSSRASMGQLVSWSEEVWRCLGRRQALCGVQAPKDGAYATVLGLDVGLAEQDLAASQT